MNRHSPTGLRCWGVIVPIRALWTGCELDLLALGVALLLGTGCASSAAHHENGQPTSYPKAPASTAPAEAANKAKPQREAPSEECLPWLDAVWSGITVIDFEPKPPGECLERMEDGSYTVHLGLRGHVMDTRGRPLTGADLDMLAAFGGDLGEGPPSYSDFAPSREHTKSDSAGAFALKSLLTTSDRPPDVYVLTVSKAGYEEERVLFRCGTLAVHVRLQPTCMSQRK